MCAVIDAFHYLPPAEATAAATTDAAMHDAPAEAAAVTQTDGLAEADAVEAAESGDEAAELADEAGAEAAAGGGGGKREAAAAAQAADIRAALLKRVLPGLSAQLVSKGDVSVQLSKTAAVTLLLKNVPAR